MRYHINKFLLLAFCLHQPLQAITLVYNMKIRRVFEANTLSNKENKSRWVATAVPIVYTRNRTIVDNALGINVCEQIIIGGALLNLRYISPESSWVEVTTGIEKEHVKSQGSSVFTNSRTGLDDIVISVGHNIFPTDKTQIVFYGLAGLPTHRKVTLLETFNTPVGTRFFSVGLGSEFSYSFINTIQKSLLVLLQARFVHFFNRNWSPILPVDAKIQPGNVTDLLFTAQYRKRRNIFETGYNPTFFTNQAVILKTGTVPGPHFVRHSVYGSFAHVCKHFPVLKTPVIVGTGFSVGASQRFDTRIFSCWVNISTIF